MRPPPLHPDTRAALEYYVRHFNGVLTVWVPRARLPEALPPFMCEISDLISVEEEEGSAPLLDPAAFVALQTRAASFEDAARVNAWLLAVAGRDSETHQLSLVGRMMYESARALGSLSDGRGQPRYMGQDAEAVPVNELGRILDAVDEQDIANLLSGARYPHDP